MLRRPIDGLHSVLLRFLHGRGMRLRYSGTRRKREPESPLVISSGFRSGAGERLRNDSFNF
jgi:hypothetical protein